MKYNIFLVDVYNLFYKASWVNDDTTIKTSNKETIHTGGIIGFLNLMDGYIKKYGNEDTKIFWLFDNATTTVNKYRKELSEDYKALRQKQPDYFYKALDMLELILRYYKDNSYIYRLKFCEADDFVDKVIDNYTGETDKVLMFSEDSDWCRFLNDNVHQYKNHRLYTKETFFEENGYEATYSNICFHKCFYGDTADNIQPTLINLPKTYFLEIIKQCENMRDFLSYIKNHSEKLSFLDLGWQAKITKEYQNLLLNWNLVESADISDSDLNSHRFSCDFKKQKLDIIYSTLQIKGKVDTQRFPNKVEKGESLFDMFNGVDLDRKK